MSIFTILTNMTTVTFFYLGLWHFFCLPVPMNQNTLRQTSLNILNMVDNMPTLPDRFVKIQAILDDPDSTLSDLTAMIQTDHATSATLLKAANSSFYNPLGAPVSNLAYAISRLGRQETGDIALSMSLLYGFAIPAGIGLIRRLWSNAYAVAQIGRFITQQLNLKGLDPETVFMACLLHDIGRVILSMRVDMSYFEKPFSALEGQALISAEVEAYGIDHAEVGQIILKAWGIPSDIHDIVAAHHQISPTLLATKTCKFADSFALEYLHTALSIEDVQIKLKEGLLEQAYESFCETALSGD